MNTLVETALSSLDHWLASSLLQKSIRRGDARLAKSAFERLWQHRGQRAYRRLVVIAVEDIGLGSIDLVVEIIATVDRLTRSFSAPDLSEALSLIHRMAEAGKDRSADYVSAAALYLPLLAEIRQAAEQMSMRQREEILIDPSECLLKRGFLSLAPLGATVRPSRVALKNVLQVLVRAGASIGLVRAMERALVLTGEPFCVLLPLIEIHARHKLTRPAVIACPRTLYVNEVPMYALDKHTSLGRSAILEFSRKNPNVERVLAAFQSEATKRAVALMSAFYTDAFCTARKVVWSGQQELENLGIEADFAMAGAMSSDAWAVLDAFRGNLDDLNEVRARHFRSRSGKR